METYLLALAIILLSTKVLGLATEAVSMPQIVGALLAGVVLGPSGLGIVADTDLLDQLATIGVILLMFNAGLQTNLGELKKMGATTFVIAAGGIVLSVLAGAGVCTAFFGITSHTDLLRAVFVGVVLASTSVSITVEAMREMGKMDTKIGSAILGAAIIDDILGILLLTVVSGFADETAQTAAILGKVGAYFVFLIVVAFAANLFFKRLDKNRAYSKRTAVFLVSFCLLMAYVSEAYFGIADITGAYFAGMMVCSIHKTSESVAQKVDIASYLFFSPVFFASIGLQTELEGFDLQVGLFCIALLAAAVLAKIIGCGLLGAKLMGFSTKEAFGIGAGMVCRGEVTLIVANKAQELGVLEARLFPAVVVLVIATALLSPVLLRMAFNAMEHGKPALQK